MASKKISQLNSTTSFEYDDVFVVNNAGVTKKTTFSTVKDALSSLYKQNFIEKPLPVTNKDVLTYDGTAWVADLVAKDNLDTNVADNSRGILLQNSGLGVKLANTEGLTFNGNGDVKVKLDNTEGLTFNSNGDIKVKLDNTGGLMFNGSGEIKVAPAAAASNLVVVRPSDPTSTDNLGISRTTNNLGELAPYFRTLTLAADWSRNNIIGRYRIAIDDDTIEGEAINWPVQVQGDGIVAQFVDQNTVDQIFGAGSIMRPGIYVWPRNPNQIMRGGIAFGYNLGNASSASTMDILARYLRNNQYFENRFYNEAPKAISYNVYFSNDNTLDMNSLNDDNKWGAAGTRINNWSNRVVPNNTTHGYLYVRNGGMGVYENSKVYIKNINFVTRTNVSDVAPVDVQNSTVTTVNLTLSFLGSGFYNFGGLRSVINGKIILHGEQLLSPETGQSNYPGYALAVVGNAFDVANDLNSITKLHSLFLTELGGSIRVIDYNPFRPNNSYVTSSIILDGDFLFESNTLISIYNSSTVELSNAIFMIANNCNFRGIRLNNNTSTNDTTFPVYMNKGNTFTINLPDARVWTLNNTIDNTNITQQAIPALNGDQQSSGLLTLQGNNYDFEITRHEFISSNVPGSLRYIELSNLPQVNNYYNIVENGNTYTINYGAGVRV